MKRDIFWSYTTVVVMCLWLLLNSYQIDKIKLELKSHILCEDNIKEKK